MKNRIGIMGVISFALIIAFSMVACDNQTPEEKARADLTGTWKDEDGSTIKFSGNTFEGTIEGNAVKGTFTASDNVITVKWTDPDSKKVEAYAIPYKLEGNKLTLWPDDPDNKIVLTKS
jgi:polyisoprenoid-binding protein YceI